MIVLRPSSAHRWAKCSLSVDAPVTEGSLPDDDTDAAREGTCAAWVAEVVINGDAGSAEDMLGKVHNNGWTVDENMVRFVQPYIDMVMSRHDPEAEVSHGVVIGDCSMTGTSDAQSYSADKRVLFIDDLKYGYGVVEPYRNRQLICYAFLAVARGIPDTVELIQLSIYQPRAQHSDGIYRKWVVSLEELQIHFNEIKDAAMRISSDRIGNPGPHCLHCRLAAKCEALTHSVYTMFDTVSSRDILSPNGQQLADEMDMIERLDDLLNARKIAVETEVEIRLGQQKFVPGWGMIDKKGKSAWKHDPEIIGALCGIDPYEKKPVTPAEAKRRGAPEALVKSMSYLPVIGKKLERVTDRKIKDMFK